MKHFSDQDRLGSVYCTESMHILIMLARISLVGWGFSWQDERHRGSQIISSFLITRCCKNREFMQVLQLMGKTPKLSPDPFFRAPAFLQPFISIHCFICYDAFPTLSDSLTDFLLPSLTSLQQTTI